MCIKVVISAPWVEYVCALHTCFHSNVFAKQLKVSSSYQLSWNIQQTKRVKSQLIQILLINLWGIFQKYEKKFELNLWQWYLLTVSKSELLPSLQCPLTRHWWAASTAGVCSFVKTRFCYVHPDSTTNFIRGVTTFGAYLSTGCTLTSHLTLWRHWRGKTCGCCCTQLGNSLQSFLRLQFLVLKIKAEFHCLFCWVFSIWDNWCLLGGVSTDEEELACNYQPCHKHYIAVRF